MSLLSQVLSPFTTPSIPTMAAVGMSSKSEGRKIDGVLRNNKA
jgi:hypothetical protein